MPLSDRSCQFFPRDSFFRRNDFEVLSSPVGVFVNQRHFVVACRHDSVLAYWAGANAAVIGFAFRVVARCQFMQPVVALCRFPLLLPFVHVIPHKIVA
jgi:hypothetical protein